MTSIKITKSWSNVIKGSLKKALNRPVKMISSLNQKWFMALVKKYGFRLVGLSLYSSSRKIHARVQLFNRFGNYLYIMSRRHGVPYTVKYLKACQLAVQKAIAGQPLKSLRELEPDLPLPRLTKSGLPAIIQLRDRAAIKTFSANVIRLWLTFFAIYRVIESPFNPKLSTITDPFSGNDTYRVEFERLVPSGMKVFETYSKGLFPLNLEQTGSDIMLILKSAPLFKVSTAGILVIPHYMKEIGIWSKLLKFNELIGNNRLIEQLNRVDLLGNGARELLDALPDWATNISSPGMVLGKLSFKEEAAGKLRVFALVDCLTQSTLKPLHDALFSFLRRLPNDGTFDQEAAFSRAQDKASISGKCFGYDLSAATDRLPISLQTKILENWIGGDAANLWKELLVDRDYYVHPNAYDIPVGPYRYAVGQPMGAYSSWAMLAVTHHYIVQWAYSQAYPLKRGIWFEGYEILGDDIVIFDEHVANKYLEIMRELGVGINLSKSVVSNPGYVVEFAKRTSVKGRDVSAISLKMLMAAKDIKMKAQVALYLGLKVGTGVVNYFKNLHAFGPSSLYKMKDQFKALANAESRLVFRLLEKGAGNLISILGLFRLENQSGWIRNDGQVVRSAVAKRLIDNLIKNREIHLYGPSEDLFEVTEDGDTSVWVLVLKEALTIKVTRMLKNLNLDLSRVYSAGALTLLSWWVIAPAPTSDCHSMYLPNSLRSEMVLNEMVGEWAKQESLSNGIEESLATQLFYDKYYRLEADINQFLYEVFIIPRVTKFCKKISKLLDKDFSGDNTDMGLFFSGVIDHLNDQNHLREYSCAQLFELAREVGDLQGLYTAFKFAPEKIIGMKPASPEIDPDSFSISLINELDSLMKKGSQSNAINYWMDTFDHDVIFQ